MLEYTVEAEQVVPNVSTARAKRAQIFFDSSPGQSEHLLNPAELLLSAFSACMLKNVERLAPILRFSYTRAAVRVHGVREDKPPRLVRIDWELQLWTDEPPARVDLLERNLRKQGTIVQVGLHPGNSGLNWHNVTFKDVDIRGSWAYPTHLWPRVIDMIASGAIPATKVVTKKIRLDQAVTEGFDVLLDPAGTQLKILIDLT